MEINWMSILKWFILVLGVIFLLRILREVLRTLFGIFYPFIIGRPKNLKTLAGSDWAVVTGSTDGIGKAYAFELAKHSFNLVLISRNQTKLDKTAEELHAAYPEIQIQTIAFNFTNTKTEDYESVIFSLLDNLPIGLLVNNVGMIADHPGQLHQISLQQTRDMLMVDVVPSTLLTSRILTQMAKRNRGIIVNVASAAAFYPTIFWATYSASKKYMTWLDSVLRKEYASTRIHIQSVCPMMVKTNMSAIVEDDYPDFMKVTSKTFARQAVRSIGLVSITTGCISHQIQYSILFKLIPGFLMDLMYKYTGNMIRKRAMDKLEQNQPGTSTTGVGEPLIS